MDTEQECKQKDKNAENAQAAESKATKTKIERFVSLTKNLLAVSRDELREQEDKWRKSDS